MLVAWKQNVNEFCIELRIGCESEGSNFWVILVHASTDDNEGQQQWDFLKIIKQRWVSQWVLGGDLNDIKNNEEKKGGRKWQDHSF